MKLPDSEIPPLGEIEARLKRLRECRSFIDGLVKDLEYLQGIYPSVLKQQNELLSIRETAELVIGQTRKARIIELLKEFVADLDAKGDAREKMDPASVTRLGKTWTRVRLKEKLKNNEPFWTREDCLAMRPIYLDWQRNRPSPAFRRLSTWRFLLISLCGPAIYP